MNYKGLLLLLVASICILSNVQSQASVYINDKKIAEEETIILTEIKDIKLRFTATETVSTSTNGIASIRFDHYDNSNNKINSNYYYEANGTTAANAFINNKDKLFIIATQDPNEGIFANPYKSYMDFLKSLTSKNNCDIVCVKVKILYADKIGYEQYGTPIEIVEPFRFFINTRQ